MVDGKKNVRMVRAGAVVRIPLTPRIAQTEPMRCWLVQANTTSLPTLQIFRTTTRKTCGLIRARTTSNKRSICNAVPANSLRLSAATTVIVIDGTWSEAKKIYRENTWIADLPHIALSPLLRSRYRIRKQPCPECLSTIEAPAYMFIENSSSPQHKTAAYVNLLEGFDRMVDTHLQSIPADKRSYYDSNF